jgi:TolA-binding protein
VLGQEPPRALPRESALAPAESATRWPRGRLIAGLPAVALALLAGCASVADVTGTATQQDLVELRGEVAAAQQAAQRARSDAEGAATRAVDARLRAQGTESERQLTALTRRLDGLTTSLTELVARVDELASRVDALGRQVRGAAPAVPPRTASPVTPGASPTPGAPGTSPGLGTPPATTTPPLATATPSVSPGTRPATNALQPQDIYQAAYIDFSKGSYALAMAGFREFLRRFPDHTLAGNAQYWIGESHFSLARGHANAGQADKATQELEQAVQELRKVVANYPRGEKAPTALYKEALALIELKQPGLAQQRLEYLVANFPQAEETPMARERLAAIKTR